MTFEVLRALRAHRAFTPAPRQAELPDVYVKFDDLIGCGRFDSALAAALRAGQRVQIVAPSGAGKSSIIQSVLNPLTDGVLPISVPVAFDQPEVATEPMVFIAHLLTRIRREATALDPGARVARGHVKETTSRLGAEWGVPGGPKLLAARDVKRVFEAQATTSSDRLEQLHDVLTTVKAHDLMPVLVLDDTDKWIRVAVDDAGERRRAFFTRIPRLLAEHIDAAVVLSVHPDYLTDPGYQIGREFLEDVITLPQLPSVAALSMVMERRVGVALGQIPASLADIIAPEGLAHLFDYYRSQGEPSIRGHVVANVHRALAHALDADAERVEEGHIQAAIAEGAS